MKIPQEYKQTEVGIIPEDWEIIRLKDIGTFSKGCGISRAEANSGHIPCVRYGEIYTSHDIYIKKFYSFISEDIAKCSRQIKKGDILFAASGETKEEIGKCVAFVSDCEAYAGGDIIIFTPKSKFDSKYLGFILNTSELTKQKASKGQGDAVVHITTESLSELIVPIPSRIDEQQEIAEALSDVDKLIAALDKKIAKKKLIKQAAMQQLLTGKKRLQGFCEKWHTILLANNTIMNSGGTPLSSNPEYYDGDIPFLSISDITDAGKYINKTERCITEKGLNNSSAKMFVKGTIMYAMYASLGKCAISNISLTCSQAILGIVPNNEIDSEYLYYYLCFIEDSVKELGQTGTQSNLSKQLVQNFAVFLPKSITEQQAIAKILSDMDEEILDLERKRDKYKLLKNGMMQKLLTGQIRLNIQYI